MLVLDIAQEFIFETNFTTSHINNLSRYHEYLVLSIGSPKYTSFSDLSLSKSIMKSSYNCRSVMRSVFLSITLWVHDQTFHSVLPFASVLWLCFLTDGSLCVSLSCVSLSDLENLFTNLRGVISLYRYSTVRKFSIPFPMVSLEIFIDLNLSSSLLLWGRLSL